MPRISFLVILPVPISRPLYTCRESAEITSAPVKSSHLRRCGAPTPLSSYDLYASSAAFPTPRIRKRFFARLLISSAICTARALLPEAVGPTMTRIFCFTVSLYSYSIKKKCQRQVGRRHNSLRYSHRNLVLRDFALDPLYRVGRPFAELLERVRHVEQVVVRMDRPETELHHVPEAALLTVDEDHGIDFRWHKAVFDEMLECRFLATAVGHDIVEQEVAEKG